MPWYVEMFSREDPARAQHYCESDMSRAQVDFVVNALGLQYGDRVLDLCCGQGRHLLEMIRRGIDAVGVDLSEYMLGKCKSAAAREGISPNLLCCDMREIAFDSEFDAAVNLFTSFGYLESDDEHQRAISAVSNALRPGGKFLIDLLNRDWLMANFQRTEVYENDRGDIILAERNFDPRSSRLCTQEVTISIDGSRIDNSHFLRLFTFNEMERMLNNSGLNMTGVWGDFDASDFTLDSRRMIIAATKSK